MLKNEIFERKMIVELIYEEFGITVPEKWNLMMVRHFYIGLRNDEELRKQKKLIG